MEWTPGSGDISGVRAPIEMRFDGLVCGGGPEEAFASSWIAIESSAGNSITQIGFLHFFNSVLGTGEFCRVWAIDGGAAHTYGCNQQTNHTIVYFEIVRFTDPSTHAILYDILDCGTAGGYGNCASENSTQGAYSSAFSPVAAETDYGQSACTVRIMGSTTDAQKFGTSSFPIEGTLGTSSWQTRSYNGTLIPTCSHYGHTFKSFRMWTWDDRNS
jgi:hypothetical protein